MIMGTPQKKWLLWSWLGPFQLTLFYDSMNFDFLQSVAQETPGTSITSAVILAV